MSARIRGKVGADMIEAALAEIHDDWTDHSWDTFGLKMGRGSWRGKMRSALEAAFDKLLEPPHD